MGVSAREDLGMSMGGMSMGYIIHDDLEFLGKAGRPITAGSWGESFLWQPLQSRQYNSQWLDWQV